MSDFTGPGQSDSSWPSGPPQPSQVPSQPPQLPVADWYPDPEQIGQLRYWDGAVWTDHVHVADGLHTGEAPTASGLTSVGAWMDQSFKGLFRVVVPLLKLHAMVLGPVVALWGVLAFMAARGAQADLSYNGRSTELEGISGVGVPAAVLAAAVGLASVLLIPLVRFAATRLVFWSHQGHNPTATQVLSFSARRLVRDIGRILLVVMFGLVLYALVIAVLVGCFYVHPLLGVLGMLATLGLLIFLFPRLIFLEPAVALAPGDVGPFAATKAVLEKRWPPIAGRVLLLWIGSTVASYAVQVIAGFGLLPLVATIANNAEVEFETVPSTFQGPSSTLVTRDGVPATSLELSDFLPMGTFVALVVFGGLLYLAALSVQQLVFAAGTTHIYDEVDAPAESPPEQAVFGISG